MILHMVRHGETEWNRNGRWQGQTDVPLSAAGRAQAARLARRLAETGVRFEALYSSDLARAWQTAAPICGALGLQAAAAPELREIDLGRWSGHTAEEIARAFPADWARLEAGEDIARGGAETFAVFLERVLGWMNRAAQRHPAQRICAVTHGGCVRAALLSVRGLTWAERKEIPAIANASVTVLEHGNDRWTIQSVNEIEAGNGEPPLTDTDEGKLV